MHVLSVPVHCLSSLLMYIGFAVEATGAGSKIMHITASEGTCQVGGGNSLLPTIRPPTQPPTTAHTPRMDGQLQLVTSDVTTTCQQHYTRAGLIARVSRFRHSVN